MHVRVRVDLILLEPVAHPAGRRVTLGARIVSLMQRENCVPKLLPFLCRNGCDVPPNAITKCHDFPSISSLCRMRAAKVRRKYTADTDHLNGPPQGEHHKLVIQTAIWLRFDRSSLVRMCCTWFCAVGSER